MKKLILLVVCIVAASLNAASLTVTQALELRAGLQALDGQQQVVPQGEQPAKIVVTPFKFSGDTRWKIATILVSLKPFLEKFEEFRTLTVKTHGVDKDPKDQAKLDAFSVDINKRLQFAEDFPKLPIITKAELRLDENQIPGTVLLVMMPVLKE